MWNVLKAEVSYVFWRNLAAILIFSLMGIYFTESEMTKNPKPIEQLIKFAMMGLIVPAYLVKVHMQKVEYEENRIRQLMQLPLTVTQVAKTRIWQYVLVFLSVAPIWYYLIGRMGVASSWALTWLIITLITLALTFANIIGLANELQYQEKKRKVLTLTLFWGSGLLLVVPIFIGLFYEGVRNVYESIAKLALTPFGPIIGISLLIGILIPNLRVFLKRESYVQSHKPEISVSDFFRTFRGDIEYRESK